MLKPAMATAEVEAGTWVAVATWAAGTWEVAISAGMWVVRTSVAATRVVSVAILASVVGIWEPNTLAGRSIWVASSILVEFSTKESNIRGCNTRVFRTRVFNISVDYNTSRECTTASIICRVVVFSTTASST
eukprot:TRINITY_DN54253_c0_g1_i1.p3 TRINITY_DN54253_c0_g1~~TRINITY_DN54253_c0_g1_i1.p3  ORF type:complete len:132 (+),score=9.19 TRINITY_DN54253_c0_g1_i1:108-503(+)